MAKRKRKYEFFLEGRGERKFRVGEVFRFSWDECYRGLQVLHEEVEEPELKLRLNSLLNSSREMIHAHLFEVLQAIQYEDCVVTARVQAAGWIIACYGYTRGLPVLSEDNTWPHPAPIKRKRVPKFHDIRDNLVCPLCGKVFVPPKNYKSKDPIIRWFTKKLVVHMNSEYHTN